MVSYSRASSYAAKRTERAMISTVTIKRGNLGTLDPVTLKVGGLSSASTIYMGKAHIHNVNGAGVITVGQEQVDTRTVAISIPISAPMPHRDDLVTVNSDSDLDLPNRTFRVLEVQVGGLLGSAHVMTCQGWFESRYW